MHGMEVRLPSSDEPQYTIRHVGCLGGKGDIDIMHKGCIIGQVCTHYILLLRYLAVDLARCDLAMDNGQMLRDPYLHSALNDACKIPASP